MKSNVWQRLDLIARNLLPFSFTILLIMIGMLPIRPPEAAPLVPSLALIAVFFWTIYRPELMPEWAVFLIGLFQDLLGGGLVGIGTLTLLLVQQVVKTQRRTCMNAPFILVWSIFALVTVGAGAVVWLLTCALHLQLVSPMPGVFEGLLTLAFYPLLAWIFARMQRLLLR